MAAPTDKMRVALRESGLIIEDHGVQGLSVETTNDLDAAIKRHERTLRFIDEAASPVWTALSPGARLLLLLPSNEMTLIQQAIDSATSLPSTPYFSGEQLFVEWASEGYLDRREVSFHTAESAMLNRGFVVTARDWRTAIRALTHLHPMQRAVPVYDAFLADAAAWWYTRLPGPLFAHVLGWKRFQLLPRHALARGVSGKPQVDGLAERECLPDGIDAHRLAGGAKGGAATFKLLIAYVSNVARDKPSKDHGRALIVERINLLLPAAAKEGPDQVLILGAIRHALQAGGMRGGLWAPVTIYDYLRVALPELSELLVGKDISTLAGAAMHGIYAAMLAKVRESQRPKFAAFIQVFHRFLTLAGAEPLPSALLCGADTLPPAAAAVWPSELARVIDYVDVVSPTVRIALQAKLLLLMGSLIPTRTVEFWCIRLGDVFISEVISVVLYPRRRDGVGKSPSVRRIEDVEDLALRRVLIDLVKLRRHDGALDADLLLGQPGLPGSRHAQQSTEGLANAALRWATGDERASVYDLRHTCFSNKAAEILARAEPTDGLPFLQLSAQGGHAGPDSTWWYIHRIEPALVQWSRRARSASWGSRCCPKSYATVFEDLCDGQVTEIPQLPEGPSDKPPRTSADLPLGVRFRILREIQLNRPVDMAAAAAEVEQLIAEQVIGEMSVALTAARLQHVGSGDTLRDQCRGVTAKLLWGRAARQPKHEELRIRLEEMVNSGEWSGLRLLWQDWLQCARGGDISLGQARSAARLINFLTNAGCPRESLVISSVPGAPGLAEEVRSLGIDMLTAKPRRGQAAHRLFMSPRGIRAATASGATLSMFGFSWWMLVVGSALVARGEV